LRNQADNMCYQLEKMMKEHADKLSDKDKAPLQKAIEKTRAAAKGDDAAAIKSAIEELEQASHAFSKAIYEKAGAAAASSPGNGADAGTRAEDDAIDAEFEVKE
jgi:molecular chaperone DnaK